MHLCEDAQSVEAVAGILTSYLTGVSAAIAIIGTQTSTKIAPLAPALSTVHLDSTVNGINAGLIQYINISGGLLTMVYHPNIATFDIILYNPLDTSFQLLSIDAETGKYIDCGVLDPTGFYAGTYVVVGSIHYTLSESLLLSTKSTITVHDWPVNINPNPDSVLPSIFGKQHYDVTQNVSVIVGDGFADPKLFYFQNDIPWDLHIAELPDAGSLDCPASFLSVQSLLNGTRIINGTTPANATTGTVLSSIIPTTTSASVPVTTTQEASSTTSVVTTTVAAITTTTVSSSTTTAASVTVAAAPTNILPF